MCERGSTNRPPRLKGVIMQTNTIHIQAAAKNSQPTADNPDLLSTRSKASSAKTPVSTVAKLLLIILAIHVAFTANDGRLVSVLSGWAPCPVFEHLFVALAAITQIGGANVR